MVFFVLGRGKWMLQVFNKTRTKMEGGFLRSILLQFQLLVDVVFWSLLQTCYHNYLCQPVNKLRPTLGA